MKVALYARVSTDRQLTENQLPALIERAKREKWDYEVFEEQESSRKTRPVKDGILTALRNREFDGVLVYAFDRWARSLPEFILEMEEFKATGISFFSIKEGFSYESAMGKAMMQVAQVFAELERDLTRERIMESRDRILAIHRETGIWRTKSGKPWGRQRKDHSAYRDEVIELRSQGLSWSQIAERTGIPPTSARRLAINPPCKPSEVNGGDSPESSLPQTPDCGKEQG